MDVSLQQIRIEKIPCLYKNEALQKMADIKYQILNSLNDKINSNLFLFQPITTLGPWNSQKVQREIKLAIPQALPG